MDPLKRITIPEIRQHPWFAQHLPRYLAVMQVRGGGWVGVGGRLEGCLCCPVPMFQAQNQDQLAPQGPLQATVWGQTFLDFQQTSAAAGCGQHFGADKLTSAERSSSHHLVVVVACLEQPRHVHALNWHHCAKVMCAAVAV